MTASHYPPATAPGDPAEYDTAAELAVTAAALADAVDDNRPDWLDLAVSTAYLLASLMAVKTHDGFDDLLDQVHDRARDGLAMPLLALTVHHSAGLAAGHGSGGQTAELFDAAPYRRNPR